MKNFIKAAFLLFLAVLFDSCNNEAGEDFQPNANTIVAGIWTAKQQPLVVFIQQNGDCYNGQITGEWIYNGETNSMNISFPSNDNKSLDYSFEDVMIGQSSWTGYVGRSLVQFSRATLADLCMHDFMKPYKWVDSKGESIEDYMIKMGESIKEEYEPEFVFNYLNGENPIVQEGTTVSFQINARTYDKVTGIGRILLHEGKITFKKICDIEHFTIILDNDKEYHFDPFADSHFKNYFNEGV